MDLQTQSRPMSAEEWLAHTTPEGFRSELVDGVVHLTPRPGPRHQRVLRHLIQQVIRSRPRPAETPVNWYSPCRFLIEGTALPRGREPDLGIYDRDPPDLDHPLAWQHVLPIVVAEVVSPEPEEEVLDHVDKKRDYWLADIPEYWIVDFKRRSFLASRRTEHGWDGHQILDGGTYSTPLLPDFVLDVGKLWL